MKRLIIILFLICTPVFGQNSLTDEQILQIKEKVEKIQKENEILNKHFHLMQVKRKNQLMTRGIENTHDELE